MDITRGSVLGCYTSGCALFRSGINDAPGFGRHRKTLATSLETWAAVLALVISSGFSSAETTGDKGHGADGLEGGGEV